MQNVSGKCETILNTAAVAAVANLFRYTCRAKKYFKRIYQKKKEKKNRFLIFEK